jgi:hypothetical protein
MPHLSQLLTALQHSLNNLALSAELLSDQLQQHEELTLRFNLQHYIARVQMKAEIHDLKAEREVRFVDLRRDFVHVEEPRSEEQFGKLTKLNA